MKNYPANRQKGFVTHASTRNCVSAAAAAAAANLSKQIDDFKLVDRLKRVTTKCLHFLPLLLSLRSGR